LGVDDLKLAIQRRRYADYLRRGAPIPADLKLLFGRCPKCTGRGEVGYAIINSEQHTEVDDVCPECDGEGFVRRDA
jgi:hypothetical protein